MVDAGDAKLISEEVQARYGQSLSTKIVRKDSLMPTDGKTDTVWQDLKDVPPSFFDNLHLYLVEPYENWPTEGQIDQGPGGTPGLSKRYTFFLVAREFAHKQYCPGSLFMQMQERAVLQETQFGWNYYQPYFDMMLCDALNMTSEWVKDRFTDYPNIFESCVIEKNGLKVSQLFSNGADIISWEEVTCRTLLALAEESLYEKQPDQSPSAGSAGALWPGLKKNDVGKAQMVKLLDYFDLVKEAVEHLMNNNPKEYIITYRTMAEVMKDILGDAAAYILPPLPVELANDMTDLLAIGTFKYQEEAMKFIKDVLEEVSND